MIRSLLATLFLALVLTTTAQEVRVVEGRKYIVHQVVQGQTLWGISRHYAVPVTAITAANPAAAQGLSLGQVLLIPQDAVVKKELKTAPQFKANGELVHTVAKRETLFGIAKKYGVEQVALIERNPQAAGGLKEGMQLVIPPATSAEVPASAAAPAKDDQSRSHLVMAGETLYSLSKQYGVSQEEVQAANGGLPQGLKVGMYVRIPVATEVEAPKPSETVTLKDRYKVAFLLPFAIAANDSVMARDTERRAYHEVTDIAVQFYAGARMAIDSLEGQGLSADIGVHDVGSEAAVWGPVLKDPAMRSMDLFIGPFNRSAIDQLLKVSNGAHVVCPVPQSNKVLLGNPTVSKVVSGRPDQVQAMARHAVQHHAKDNIILVRPDIPAEKEVQDQMLRALQEALALRMDKRRDSVLVARTGRREVNAIVGLLNTGQRNVVLAPSEDVEFVAALVSKLAALSKENDIVVYGMGNWSEMEPVAPQDMDKVHLRVPASSYIDRADPRVQAFIHAYRERYNDEPRDYAFLGFDITTYYLTALMTSGRGFAEHFGEVHTVPLHMGFRMMRTGPENGFRNESVMILEHEAMGLRRVP